MQAEHRPVAAEFVVCTAFEHPTQAGARMRKRSVPRGSALLGCIQVVKETAQKRIRNILPENGPTKAELSKSSCTHDARLACDVKCAALKEPPSVSWHCTAAALVLA